jgi:cation diffusion facilitator family transporter
MSTAQLQRNTIIGLAASVLLAAGKLAAGLIGHSSALVADAVESLADTVGAVIVWQALRHSARPPDEDHPYGHGKFEAIAALVVGGLLLVAAALIIVEAFREILTPHQAPAAWTLAVLLIVIAVKEGLFRLLLRGAREFDSQAAHADAWHHRSDAITTAAAVVGVAIAVWGPGLTGVAELVLADEAAAMIASGIIVRTAISLLRPPLRELVDAAPLELIERIRVAAGEVEGVRLVEQVRARKSGRGYFVDMHLHVDPELSVRVAHALSGKVKAHILQQIPNVTQVLIHIEPDETGVSAGP